MPRIQVNIKVLFQSFPSCIKYLIEITLFLRGGGGNPRKEKKQNISNLISNFRLDE